MNPLVLVIEDNEQNLYLIRFLLEKNGFTVLRQQMAKKEWKWRKRRNPILFFLISSFPKWTGMPSHGS